MILYLKVIDTGEEYFDIPKLFVDYDVRKASQKYNRNNNKSCNSTNSK